MSKGKPTRRLLEEWRARVWAVLGEAEVTYGENAAGEYPSDVEMALRMTLSTLDRAVAELERRA